MITVDEIRDAAKKAADWAIEREPLSSNYRAQLFIAYLAGRIEEREPAMAAELDRVRTFDVTKTAPTDGPEMSRIEPDLDALEIAHRLLHATVPLDDMLRTPALAGVLWIVASNHMQCRAQRDVKKLQANDRQEES